MAARTRKLRHDEETRGRIKASQLINRLQDHVLSDVEMSPTQLNAANILLKKVLPDLTENSSTLEIEHRFVIELPSLPESSDQWQQQFAPNQITKLPGGPNGHNSH